MAHNIATIDGQSAVFTARVPAWHQLGITTPDCQTWEQALKLAHLDWPVVLNDISSADTNGLICDLSNYKAVWRGNGSPACLGIVGKDFQPIQNREAFDFVDSLLGATDGAHYESAGALGQGETIWVLARVPGADIQIAGTDDKSESYLMFATGHAGNMSAVAKLTSVRVVCQNTLSMALSKSGACFKVKHTKSAQQKLQSALAAMSGVVADAKALESKLNTLAARKMTKDTMLNVINRLFPENKESENQSRRNGIVTKVLELFESNDGDAIPEVRGTAYNLLNAVTEYTDHFRSARLTDSKQGMTLDQARAQAAVFGTGEKLKTDALEILLAGTKDNPVITRQIVSKPVQSSGSLLDQIIANHA